MVVNYAFFWLLGHESAVSEFSLCSSRVGCGTSSTNDEEFLPPKKRRKMTKSTSAVSISSIIY